jgi:poly-beta-1,6-N-acetyl-D-glucosamine N-deacetylase
MILKKFYFYILFLLFLLPSKSFAENLKEKGIISLMYHRFEENKYPTTNIKTNDFKKQIELIKDAKLEFIGVDQLLKILVDKEPYANKKILLTVDDAFESFYKNAWPILKDKKIPFILFVSTREVNAKHPNYMTWDQVREIHQSKIGTIGGHSFSHEYLVDFTKDDIIKDIQKSHDDYIKELGSVPKIFSYPFGEYSNEIKKIVVDFGYKLAFGQHSGVIHQNEDMFELPRFPINEAYGKIDRFNFLLNTSPLPHKFYKPEEKLLSSNNPPNIEIEFLMNVKNINCFSNEGDQWGPSEVTFLDDNWIRIILKKKFESRRGKFNCTMQLSDGSWGWFGRQFVINN